MNTVAMLEDMGHAVLEAPSGARALEMLGTHRVDLVLADQAMPRTDAWARTRGANPRKWPSLPVVMATGYAELPANSLALPKLGKPFDQRDLQRAITEVLHVIARGCVSTQRVLRVPTMQSVRDREKPNKL